MKARMLFSIWALLVTSAKADANENHVVVPPSRHSDLALPVEGSPEHSAGDRVGSEVLADRTHQEVSSEAKDEESEKKDESIVVAMEEKSGASIRSGEIVSTKDEAAVYINRENIKLELSPRSVGEFDSKGEFRLLRGSAVLESRKETTMQTTGSRVDFVGKVVASYDHLEKSSSVFVLAGEARLVNAHRSDSSIRLQRFRGATLVVGDVLPKLLRQLDLGAVDSWLKGYGWSEAHRKSLLRGMPEGVVAVKDEIPGHLEETKIGDYFSSIDTADEFHQPEYYEKKFADPDKVVAEQNSKMGSVKVLSPEEAALISLPSTQIDLGFDLGPEVVSAEQKEREVRKLDVTAPVRAKRVPASRESKVVKKKKKVAEVVVQGDPAVLSVLDRLRRIRGGQENTALSPASSSSRSPASKSEPVVPDPVYDYSQNF